MQLPSDYLAEGWCQGRLKEGQSVCFVGAVCEAWSESIFAGPGTWCDDAESFLNTARTLAGTDLIASWNDQEGRTQEEVVTLARRVEVSMGLRVEERELVAA